MMNDQGVRSIRLSKDMVPGARSVYHQLLPSVHSPSRVYRWSIAIHRHDHGPRVGYVGSVRRTHHRRFGTRGRSFAWPTMSAIQSLVPPPWDGVCWWIGRASGTAGRTAEKRSYLVSYATITPAYLIDSPEEAKATSAITRRSCPGSTANSATSKS